MHGPVPACACVIWCVLELSWAGGRAGGRPRAAWVVPSRLAASLPEVGAGTPPIIRPSSEGLPPLPAACNTHSILTLACCGPPACVPACLQFYSNAHYAQVAGVSLPEWNAMELDMLFRLDFRWVLGAG